MELINNEIQITELHKKTFLISENTYLIRTESYVNKEYKSSSNRLYIEDENSNMRKSKIYDNSFNEISIDDKDILEISKFIYDYQILYLDYEGRFYDKYGNLVNRKVFYDHIVLGNDINIDNCNEFIESFHNSEYVLDTNITLINDFKKGCVLRGEGNKYPFYVIYDNEKFKNNSKDKFNVILKDVCDSKKIRKRLKR